MQIKYFVFLLTLILIACMQPLDSHVPQEITAVKGRIVMVSTGRSESGGYYIINGKMVDAIGGRQIFFKDYKHTLTQGFDRFVIYSDDGKSRKEISVAPLSINLTEFDISPDGKTIAFIADDNSKGYRIGNLYVVDIDGQNLRNLTKYDRQYYYLAGVKFSPDGKTILFSRTLDRDPKYLHMFLYNLATGKSEDLTEGVRDGAFEADWSPDGKKIAFIDQDDAGFRNLYLLDLATKQVMQLTHFSQKYYGHVYHPSYSPWGDQICFALAARDKNAGSEIFAVNIDGSSLVRLTPAQKTEHYPYWAKDDYPDWGK